jgi:hypothetical protein
VQLSALNTAGAAYGVHPFASPPSAPPYGPFGDGDGGGGGAPPCPRAPPSPLPRSLDSSMAHGHAFSQALHASASMPNLRVRGPASARAMAVTDMTAAPDDAGGVTVVLRMPPFAGGRPRTRERDGSVCGGNQMQRRRGTAVARRGGGAERAR